MIGWLNNLFFGGKPNDELKPGHGEWLITTPKSTTIVDLSKVGPHRQKRIEIDGQLFIIGVY